MSKTLVLHLVSHASGELVEMLARNAVAQLEGVNVERRMWKMVRRLGQVPEILGALAGAPGYVLHSISHTDIREALEAGCHRLGVPCQFALEPLISRLAAHAGSDVRFHSSSGDAFDEDYYRRVEAMKYALAHDDGIASDDLDGADIIIVGVSRATKTPTCMYLASRGIKAAALGKQLGGTLLAFQQVDERKAREIDRRLDHDAMEDFASRFDRGDDADANPARVNAVDAGGQHRLPDLDLGLAGDEIEQQLAGGRSAHHPLAARALQLDSGRGGAVGQQLHLGVGARHPDDPPDEAVVREHRLVAMGRSGTDVEHQGAQPGL